MPKAPTFEIPRNWTFEDASIAAGFDRHVREQLQWYDEATHAIVHIARHYLPERGLVYDLGASTGNIANALAPTLKDRHADLCGIESSLQMVERYRAPGRIVHADATAFDYEPFDLAIAFLVFMFIPVEKRACLIAQLRKCVKPGGAIIILDKCAAVSGYPATVMARLTLAGKLAAGIDPAEIIAKELSLGGVQRPIDPRMLGPDAIEWFRFGEFAGWLIEGPTEGVKFNDFYT